MSLLLLLVACRTDVGAPTSTAEAQRALVEDVRAGWSGSVTARGTVEVEGPGAPLGVSYTVAAAPGAWLDVDVRHGGVLVYRSRGDAAGETVVEVRPPGGRVQAWRGSTAELPRELAGPWSGLSLVDPLAALADVRVLGVRSGGSGWTGDASWRSSAVEVRFGAGRRVPLGFLLVGPGGRIEGTLEGEVPVLPSHVVPARARLVVSGLCPEPVRITAILDQVVMSAARLSPLSPPAPHALTELAELRGDLGTGCAGGRAR